MATRSTRPGHRKHQMLLVVSLSMLPAAHSVAGQSLDGFWRSERYGNVYEIHGTTLRAFELTTRTCVAGFTATRIAPSTPRPDEIFRTKGRDPIVVSAGKDADSRLLNHTVQLNRLSGLPAVCSAVTPNTPFGNFEVFTRTFAEHYISFGLRHVDWDKVVAANREKVKILTTPSELFEILDSMIRPLGDLHTGIEAPQIKRESKERFRPGTDRVVKDGIDFFASKTRPALFAVTDSVWAHGRIRSFCKGHVQYTRSVDGTGYLRILGFGDYARFGDDARALESALDAIFEDSGLKALVIDVRLSFGGDDGLGRIIASRLTNRRYLAYSIQARSDPTDTDKWSPANSVYIDSSSRPGFRGPIVELIGPITMSAAETFTQALMGRIPPVTTIGENTQGLFCDPLERHLPNGWTFSLPNAIYRTADGRAFDVQGITPDIKIPLFADEDVAAREDPAMAMAVRLLSPRQ